MTRSRVSFDRLARPYFWLERLTFGRALERCRLFYLPCLNKSRQALVLGDGDGRFLASLLAQNRDLRADAVDLSPAMLHLLQQRSVRASPTADLRLRIHPQDARSFTPVDPPDLVVTHFFLDCLTEDEVDRLAVRLASTFAPGALWLVSDFRVPPGPLRLPAKLLVRALYLGFRILTGLRTTQLPDHARCLTDAGLERIAFHTSLFGLLFTELWQVPGQPLTPPNSLDAPRAGDRKPSPPGPPRTLQTHPNRHDRPREPRQQHPNVVSPRTSSRA